MNEGKFIWWTCQWIVIYRFLLLLPLPFKKRKIPPVVNPKVWKNNPYHWFTAMHWLNLFVTFPYVFPLALNFIIWSKSTLVLHWNTPNSKEFVYFYTTLEKLFLIISRTTLFSFGVSLLSALFCKMRII